MQTWMELLLIYLFINWIPLYMTSEDETEPPSQPEAFWILYFIYSLLMQRKVKVFCWGILQCFYLCIIFLWIFYWFISLYYFCVVHFTEYSDIWQPLNVSSVLTDSSISNFEVVQVSRDISNDFSTARDFCLSGKKCLFIAL